ncbi:hypothetical protein S7711_05466 [Stachybotrys chartarum IBT 7711]|uniref:Rhodopsin domain-containing protein n=1 Tax=Stachybotrys chartarum (strain CBS 109288 / IBT 7711) TaxID=1280523 RepID=A0A084BAY8_STACB|nr:hypothetical protein S7711_05466 [Stachybotrys chartarum IBT 7711]KFA46228.1 hypothetical protein S40293_07171 [Stachybotrys chartarum IBT 40293]
MSASGAWGPAPPGVDLTETQDGSIIGSVAVMMAIGLTAVALRLYVRATTGPRLAEDDYFILVALLLGVGTAICCLISVPWGGGKHLWIVTTDQFTRLYQTTYAFVIVYISCISATKVSIMLFYRRMFGTNLVWHVVFALAVLHWAEVTVTWLAGCRPVSYYWRQYTDPDAVGECIDAPVFYLANGCIGLVVDVAILLVPIPTVYKLKMALSQKIMVCGILLLGSFVCVASAVRIVMMYRLVNAADFTWAMSNVFIWSCCEPFVGIVCACLPTYAPLVRRGRGARRLRHAGGSGSDGHYSSSKSNGSRHEWSVRGAFDKKLGDDEMELTTNVLGGEQNHARITSLGSETGAAKILIQRDFSWSASP